MNGPQWTQPSVNEHCLETPHFKLTIKTIPNVQHEFCLVSTDDRFNITRHNTCTFSKYLGINTIQANAYQWAMDIINSLHDALYITENHLRYATTNTPDLSDQTHTEKHIIWSNMNVIDDKNVDEFLRNHLHDPTQYTTEQVYEKLYQSNTDWKAAEIEKLLNTNHFSMLIETTVQQKNNVHIFPVRIIHQATLSDIFALPPGDTELFADNENIRATVHQNNSTFHYLFRRMTTDTDSITNTLQELNACRLPGDRDLLINSISESIRPDIAKINDWPE